MRIDLQCAGASAAPVIKALLHKSCKVRPNRVAIPAMLLAMAIATPVTIVAQPITPTPFADAPRPATPNYAEASAWAVLPWAPGAAAARPAGEAVYAVNPAEGVDVFYVQPTTYHGPNWNQSLDDAKVNAWTDISVIARQASAFNACCRLFAPRYRQASSLAFASRNGDGEKAYGLAYEDVAKAFDYYLAHYNHGRPFILAGHSQGALMIYWLLERKIDGTPLKDRMVAAYPIGVAASEGEFGRTYKTIPFCAKPDSTRCIVSWNSFEAGSDVATYVQRSESRYVQRYGDAPGRDLVCINPLTFDRSKPAADAAANLGALPGDPKPGDAALSVLPPLKVHAVGAACRGGVLMVEPSADPGFHPTPLPGGLLHMHDIDLFYANLRANAALRAAAYLAKSGAPKD